MRLQTYTSPADFLAIMEPQLLQHEAKYGLMLGIAHQLVEQTGLYTHPPFLATVMEGEEVVAAASMTPPFGVILYSEHSKYAGALEKIAEHLAVEGWPVPTANGPTQLSTAFSHAWCKLQGTSIALTMNQRVFELRTVQPIPLSSGALRLATVDDLDLLLNWYHAFETEAVRDIAPTRETNERRQILRNRIDSATIYLWEDHVGEDHAGNDGVPVSFVGLTRPTAHGITIGPVYTPPTYRGRGYATSAVAQVSQLMLDSGRDFCTLFTDLANPTSNHIYQRIGYRPVTDYTFYKFATPKSA